ncbi:MAG: UDP-N-acetylmuramoyl-L-alanine--D-glutamate ligase, partial [Bacteroidota bacterium]|nr:UDP-N-acetylmuramoyl-L-alanine--D-glutamate ligase [Bacteroidota bacterium]
MKKRMVILGAGESGIGAALLAQQKGFDVFVSDGSPIKPVFKDELVLNRIDFEEGSHTEDKIFNASLIMKSPGIPEKNELIKKL